MSSATWPTIAGLAVATVLIKAFGPVIFGGRDLPYLLARTIPLLAPALLAALVVVETFGASGRSLTIDARAGAWWRPRSRWPRAHHSWSWRCARRRPRPWCER